jgi:hypothetical protein
MAYSLVVEPDELYSVSPAVMAEGH